MVSKRGKTSAEVCEMLGISYEEMMRILHTRKEGFPVEIEKERSGALIWNRTAIAALRAIVAQRGRRESRETEESRRYREAVSRLGKHL